MLKSNLVEVYCFMVAGIPMIYEIKKWSILAIRLLQWSNYGFLVAFASCFGCRSCHCPLLMMMLATQLAERGVIERSLWWRRYWRLSLSAVRLCSWLSAFIIIPEHVTTTQPTCTWDEYFSDDGAASDKCCLHAIWSKRLRSYILSSQNHFYWTGRNQYWQESPCRTNDFYFQQYYSVFVLVSQHRLLMLAVAINSPQSA